MYHPDRTELEDTVKPPLYILHLFIFVAVCFSFELYWKYNFFKLNKSYLSIDQNNHIFSAIKELPYCILLLFPMFPTMLQHREICNFIQGKSVFHLVTCNGETGDTGSQQMCVNINKLLYITSSMNIFAWVTTYFHGSGGF